VKDLLQEFFEERGDAEAKSFTDPALKMAIALKMTIASYYCNAERQTL